MALWLYGYMAIWLLYINIYIYIYFTIMFADMFTNMFRDIVAFVHPLVILGRRSSRTAMLQTARHHLLKLMSLAPKLSCDC